MNPIAPGAVSESERLRMDSRDLEQLARLISGRIHLQCPSCQNRLKLSVASRSLRMGSSPDLTGVDSRQPGYPRLVFHCPSCQKNMGFIQADEWTTADAQSEPGEPTRWEHLELDGTNSVNDCNK